MKIKKSLRLFKNSDEQIPDHLINSKNLKSFVKKSHKQQVKLILKSKNDNLKTIDLQSLSEIALENSDLGILKIFSDLDIYPDLRKIELVNIISKILNKIIQKSAYQYKNCNIKNKISIIDNLLKNSSIDNKSLAFLENKISYCVIVKDKNHHKSSHYKKYNKDKLKAFQKIENHNDYSEALASLPYNYYEDDYFYINNTIDLQGKTEIPIF